MVEKSMTEETGGELEKGNWGNRNKWGKTNVERQTKKRKGEGVAKQGTEEKDKWGN